MKKILPTLAVAASATVGTSAFAASTTTYLGGLFGGTSESFQYTTQDDVEVNATASSWNPYSHQNEDAHVNKGLLGLGVSNSVTYRQTFFGSIPQTSDDSDIDGSGFSDTLWLSFDQAFDLNGIWFSKVDHNDEVQLVDEHHQVIAEYDLGNLCDFFGIAYLDISSLNLSTTKIGFTALDCNDDFKVKSIYGMKTEAVPTPSAAAAGLMGLVALSARRRRKAAESAA